MLCSGRSWPLPPDKGETQARIPAPGFSLIVAIRSVTHMSYLLSVTSLLASKSPHSLVVLGCLRYLLSVAKSSDLEMSFYGCLRHAEDKEGPTGHC